jgi:carbonic anhydrase
MPATSLLSKINGLPRRTKIFYVSSIAISLALVVFGACLWALTGTYSASSKLEGSSVGYMGNETTSIHLTNSTSKHESVPTISPVLPILLRPTKPESSQSGLRAMTTSVPSNHPTLDASYMPSTPPTEYTSTAPSLDPSESPSSLHSTEPSNIPSEVPSQNPSSSDPTFTPSNHPLSLPPTSSSVPTTTAAPSDVPPFPSHEEPIHPDPTYFNYNSRADSKYGPRSWENVTVPNSTDNYWNEFGFNENMCGADAQSPIDLCTEPTRQCMEEHEYRSRPGDYTIDGNLTMKQILPNKLRVVMARRVGDEPDPPHTDFSGIGYRSLDMLNIDIKFPSEHTLCGRKYDGEMQYFFFHPVRKVPIGIAWLLDAQEFNATNDHMQLLIDEFQQIYDSNEDACSYNQTSIAQNETAAKNNTINNKAPKPEKDPKDLFESSLFNRNLKKSTPWDPFHVDIQKTIHFFGYSGSLTEPPCSQTLWRIMDVPIKISMDQLYQMQNILFNNRNNETCAYTSNHFNGRVARPVSDTLRYYKCTRSDYVSDDERELCGETGCDVPFGKDLEPYVEPTVFVTGPPTQSPVN